MTDEELAAALPEFFEDKGITPICESCGRNAWVVATNAAPVLAVDMSGRDKVYNKHMLICAHCGFIRYYASDVVTEWHKNRA